VEASTAWLRPLPSGIVWLGKQYLYFLGSVALPGNNSQSFNNSGQTRVFSSAAATVDPIKECGNIEQPASHFQISLIQNFLGRN
jgi:hypothetical protein